MAFIPASPCCRAEYSRDSQRFESPTKEANDNQKRQYKIDKSSSLTIQALETNLDILQTSEKSKFSTVQPDTSSLGRRALCTALLAIFGIGALSIVCISPWNFAFGLVFIIAGVCVSALGFSGILLRSQRVLFLHIVVSCCMLACVAFFMCLNLHWAVQSFRALRHVYLYRGSLSTATNNRFNFFAGGSADLENSLGSRTLAAATLRYINSTMNDEKTRRQLASRASETLTFAAEEAEVLERQVLSQENWLSKKQNFFDFKEVEQGKKEQPMHHIVDVFKKLRAPEAQQIKNTAKHLERNESDYQLVYAVPASLLNSSEVASSIQERFLISEMQRFLMPRNAENNSIHNVTKVPLKNNTTSIEREELKPPNSMYKMNGKLWRDPIKDYNLRRRARVDNWQEVESSDLLVHFHPARQRVIDSASAQSYSSNNKATFAFENGDGVVSPEPAKCKDIPAGLLPHIQYTRQQLETYGLLCAFSLYTFGVWFERWPINCEYGCGFNFLATRRYIWHTGKDSGKRRGSSGIRFSDGKHQHSSHQGEEDAVSLNQTESPIRHKFDTIQQISSTEYYTSSYLQWNAALSLADQKACLEGALNVACSVVRSHYLILLPPLLAFLLLISCIYICANVAAIRSSWKLKRQLAFEKS